MRFGLIETRRAGRKKKCRLGKGQAHLIVLSPTVVLTVVLAATLIFNINDAACAQYEPRGRTWNQAWLLQACQELPNVYCHRRIAYTYASYPTLGDQHLSSRMVPKLSKVRVCGVTIYVQTWLA